MSTMAAFPFKAGGPRTGKTGQPFFTRCSPVQVLFTGSASLAGAVPRQSLLSDRRVRVRNRHVRLPRITKPRRPAMIRSAACRDLMLVSRRHVDLLRVSSAICRAFC